MIFEIRDFSDTICFSLPSIARRNANDKGTHLYVRRKIRKLHCIITNGERAAKKALQGRKQMVRRTFKSPRQRFTVGMHSYCRETGNLL
ncbi:hypothetical protein AGR5A_Cc70167 [Agrobacterium genomosp. 5 str. CFBP 6626]|nr:hypothetical protein AGR5A_Cc70167 [Agrobacterium genomosp. 5 str. CFBP 6626]